MATQAKATPRERLLEAAATLIYQHGVGIGVDALCKAAGVSKRSMYQLFSSKDELLAASLEKGALAFAAQLLPADDDRPPRERILHVFEQMELQASAPQFRGCHYLAVQIELKNESHPSTKGDRPPKIGGEFAFGDTAAPGMRPGSTTTGGTASVLERVAIARGSGPGDLRAGAALRCSILGRWER